MMKHQAIMELHSNVEMVTIEEDGSVVCYDSSGAVVTLTDAQLSAVSTKQTELENAHKLKELRAERDSKLTETDHWMLSDTATVTQAQRDYRQSLRDITNTYTSLDDVVWPTKP